jgi:hypothetical protein
MSGRFADQLVSREHRYSIGYYKISGHYYLSVPVTNRSVDYEEYYASTKLNSKLSNLIRLRL